MLHNAKVKINSGNCSVTFENLLYLSDLIELVIETPLLFEAGGLFKKECMTHASLFSGIGGFDLAAEWMGWENVLHCEINPFCQRILRHYWPNAKSYTDIKTTDFSIHRGLISVLSGGFPCQPYSSAGKRKGKEDDRHLWPEMLRAIREIRPCWVVGENVRGLTNWNAGVVFDEVQADLENEGYQVTPFLLPACAVNAPHRRDRIWFIAHATRNDDQRNKRKVSGADGRQKFNNIPTPGESGFGLCSEGTSSNTSHQGLQGHKQHGTFDETEIREQAFRSITQFYQDSNWRDFPTQPPVRSRDDGFPDKLDGLTISKHRNESIKGYGNAVVPQIVYQLFQAIQQYENLSICSSQ